MRLATAGPQGVFSAELARACIGTYVAFTEDDEPAMAARTARRYMSAPLEGGWKGLDVRVIGLIGPLEVR